MDTNRSRKLTKFKEKLQTEEFGLKVDSLIIREKKLVETQLAEAKSKEEWERFDELLDRLHKLESWDLTLAFELCIIEGLI